MAKRIVTNIVGQTKKSDLAKVGLSYTLNMFEETKDANENLVNKILRPIKGYKSICSIEGECRGMFTVSTSYNNKPVTYAVFGEYLHLIIPNHNTPYRIGKLATSTGHVHFAETSNKPGFDTHLVLVDGNFCYAVDTQLKPSNQIEDFKTIEVPFRDYENGIRISPTHIAYLYGYLVINDSKTDSFYVSYQFPFLRNNSKDKLDNNIFMVGSDEWGYLGQSIQSYWAPDNTVALVANGSRLFTFGERSYQMFQYTSDLNIPFNSPDTAAAMIGIKAVNSLCQLGTAIVWLGSSDIGNNGIYLIAGTGTAQRISTPEIEREISTFATIEDAYAQMWQDNQHIFYCITFPSAHITYCYDITEQSWSNRSSLNDKNERVEWRYDFAVMNYKGTIWQAYNGGIAEQTEEKWNEHDDKPILRLRRGGIVVSDYSHFIINSIELLTNNGQYELLPTEHAKMMMRYSTDGSTFTDNEVVEIGKIGDYDYDCIFYNLGMAKYFTMEFSCSENIPFALYAMKVDIDNMGY